MNILVVDDDKEIRLLMSEIIRQAGHKAITADTGSRALQLAREQKFDAVFMDILLSDMNGVDLIPRFKILQSKIPVIAMTGYNTPEMEARVRQQGITVYLSKPLLASDILTIIDHLAQMNHYGLINGNSCSGNNQTI